MYYVNNKKFYQDIVKNYYPKVKEWKAAGKEGDPPPVTDFMGECIFNIAKKYAKSKNFYYLRDKHEDMIGTACLNTIKYIHNFDPEKSNNPFSYVTMIAHNSFLLYLNKETKNNKVKSAVVEKMFFEQMTSDGIEKDNFITHLKENFENEQLEDLRLKEREKEESN